MAILFCYTISVYSNVCRQTYFKNFFHPYSLLIIHGLSKPRYKNYVRCNIRQNLSYHHSLMLKITCQDFFVHIYQGRHRIIKSELGNTGPSIMMKVFNSTSHFITKHLHTISCRNLECNINFKLILWRKYVCMSLRPAQF